MSEKVKAVDDTACAFCDCDIEAGDRAYTSEVSGELYCSRECFQEDTQYTRYE